MTTILPTPITDATYAFPANAPEFMPAWEDIPQEFKDRRTEWNELVNTWFHRGLSEHFSFQPATVDGELVDALMAYRQISAILRSFAPKHEHKMAAAAYLCSLWMESAIYAIADTPLEKHTVVGDATLDEWLEVLREREQA